MVFIINSVPLDIQYSNLPFSLTTKQCFTGPISEKISVRRSFDAESGKDLTNNVWLPMMENGVGTTSY